MEVNITDAFELLTQEEWDRYLDVDLFSKMYFTGEDIGVSENFLQNMQRPLLQELLNDHNNKVGSLRITYALCRHYYDKGIPDDPWIAPGKDGQAIQYMPNFSEEHWSRQYWFNYFTNTFYLRISALWDSMIEIINHFYRYDFPSDLRLRSKVFSRLRSEKPNIMSIFDNIQQDAIYIAAQSYRTEAAHGTSPGEVHNTVNMQNDTWTEIPDEDAQGNLIIENGKVKTKKVKAKMIISVSAGEYTNANTIMTNIEDYSKLTGEKIQEIIKGLAADC